MSKNYPYAEVFPIAIKTLQFIEPLLQKELEALNIQVTSVGKRIVHAETDLRGVYRANLELRTALRVLIPIMQFKSSGPDDLYLKCLKYNWFDVLELDQTFAIDVTVNSTHYKLPHFAALRMKDGIVDYFKNKKGERPNVDKDAPDVRFLLHIDEDLVTISLDSSGESLNRRGYRISGGGAPLNEVLAAAMLLQAGIENASTLYFPMCGSGTLPIEAAMILENKPALWNRDFFGFMGWKSFAPDLWKDILQECLEQFKPLQTSIFASDVDRKAIQIAVANFKEVEFDEIIKIEQQDFFQELPKGDDGMIILNPPYGERMDPEQINHFYKRIGNHLKQHWENHTCWIISSNFAALKNVGLRPSRKIPLMNGPLECKFNEYQMFRGDRADFVKQKKEK